MPIESLVSLYETVHDVTF